MSFLFGELLFWTLWKASDEVMFGGKIPSHLDAFNKSKRVSEYHRVKSPISGDREKSSFCQGGGINLDSC